MSTTPARGRPVLQPPDLDPAQPLPPTSRTAGNDARFRVAEQLEGPEGLRDGLASGRVRALNTQTAPELFRARPEQVQPPEPTPPPEEQAPSPPSVAAPAPAPLPQISATVDVAATGRTAEEVALSTKVPAYVLKQLRLRYAEDGVTIRNQLLLALRGAGLEIDDRDITDERKRGRRP